MVIQHPNDLWMWNEEEHVTKAHVQIRIDRITDELFSNANEFSPVALPQANQIHPRFNVAPTNSIKFLLLSACMCARASGIAFVTKSVPRVKGRNGNTFTFVPMSASVGSVCIRTANISTFMLARTKNERWKTLHTQQQMHWWTHNGTTSTKRRRKNTQRIRVSNC